MKKMCIIVTEKNEAASVMSFLNLQKNDVTGLVIGSRALAEEVSRSVAEVKWIDSHGMPAENFASAAAQLLQNEEPNAVIGVSSPGTRSVMGITAVATGVAVVPSLVSVSEGDHMLCVEHMILDDKMIEVLNVPLHSCLMVSPFSLKSVELSEPVDAESIEKVDAPCAGGIEFVSVAPAEGSKLQTADRIVCVGMGATSGDLLEQANQLTELLGAELGCSMPLYSDLNIMPHEMYIGVSGQKVAPKLYLALGISGTNQHCAGIRNSGTIVCVNKDPKALFFDDADYGIVGDLNEVLPELIAALS